MKRILLTGISGVAKSTVTEQLAQRGYKAVDADGDAFSEWVEVSDELEQAAGSPVESAVDRRRRHLVREWLCGEYGQVSCAVRPHRPFNRACGCDYPTAPNKNKQCLRKAPRRIGACAEFKGKR